MSRGLWHSGFSNIESLDQMFDSDLRTKHTGDFPRIQFKKERVTLSVYKKTVDLLKKKSQMEKEQCQEISKKTESRSLEEKNRHLIQNDSEYCWDEEGSFDGRMMLESLEPSPYLKSKVKKKATYKFSDQPEPVQRKTKEGIRIVKSCSFGESFCEKCITPKEKFEDSGLKNEEISTVPTVIMDLEDLGQKQGRCSKKEPPEKRLSGNRLFFRRKSDEGKLFGGCVKKIKRIGDQLTNIEVLLTVYLRKKYHENIKENPEKPLKIFRVPSIEFSFISPKQKMREILGELLAINQSFGFSMDNIIRSLEEIPSNPVDILGVKPEGLELGLEKNYQKPGAILRRCSDNFQMKRDQISKVQGFILDRHATMRSSVLANLKLVMSPERSPSNAKMKKALMKIIPFTRLKGIGQIKTETRRISGKFQRNSCIGVLEDQANTSPIPSEPIAQEKFRLDGEPEIQKSISFGSKKDQVPEANLDEEDSPKSDQKKEDKLKTVPYRGYFRKMTKEFQSELDGKDLSKTKQKVSNSPKPEKLETPWANTGHRYKMEKPSFMEMCNWTNKRSKLIKEVKNNNIDYVLSSLKKKSEEKGPRELKSSSSSVFSNSMVSKSLSKIGKTQSNKESNSIKKYKLNSFFQAAEPEGSEDEEQLKKSDIISSGKRKLAKFYGMTEIKKASGSLSNKKLSLSMEKRLSFFSKKDSKTLQHYSPTNLRKRTENSPLLKSSSNIRVISRPKNNQSFSNLRRAIVNESPRTTEQSPETNRNGKATWFKLKGAKSKGGLVLKK